MSAELTSDASTDVSNARLTRTRPRLFDRFGKRILDRLTIIVLLAVLWTVLNTTGIFPKESIPSLAKIGSALVDETGDGQFWNSLGATIWAWGMGLLLASVIGIPLGLLIGGNQLLQRATSWVVEFLRPIPSVALLPLVVLVLGSGYQGAVFLVAFSCLWPQLVQAIYGARAIDRVGWQTALSYRLNWWQRFFKISLPSASPYVMTGFRVSSSVALIIVITSGLVIGTPGLGKDIQLFANAASYPSMYALIFVTGLLGFLMNALIAVAERRLLPWQPDNR